MDEFREEDPPPKSPNIRIHTDVMSFVLMDVRNIYICRSYYYYSFILQIWRRF